MMCFSTSVNIKPGIISTHSWPTQVHLHLWLPIPQDTLTLSTLSLHSLYALTVHHCLNTYATPTSPTLCWHQYPCVECSFTAQSGEVVAANRVQSCRLGLRKTCQLPQMAFQLGFLNVTIPFGPFSDCQPGKLSPKICEKKTAVKPKEHWRSKTH